MGLNIKEEDNLEGMHLYMHCGLYMSRKVRTPFEDLNVCIKLLSTTLSTCLRVVVYSIIQ